MYKLDEYKSYRNLVGTNKLRRGKPIISDPNASAEHTIDIRSMPFKTDGYIVSPTSASKEVDTTSKPLVNLKMP
jgi:hypothetical protein